MSLGRTPTQQALLSSTVKFCHGTLAENSIYRYLYENSAGLFPDESFTDLFKALGRDSIPPQIVAVVMVLQRLEGASDREAVDRFAYDIRWKYAAGGLDFDYRTFVHTVLVRMRARLRASKEPNRIFNVVLQVAKEGGMVGRKRVLDSTPIYDAVATQDTVTLIRSAIRGVLKVAGRELELGKVLKRDDDYTRAGKPVCDWTDAEAREELIDALSKDAYAMLSELHDRELPQKVKQAAELLAVVVDQDTEEGQDGRFRIARKVAKNRVLSTVDPEARHGHKSKARKFDGYRGHIGMDPDSEVITATAVTPGNASDVSVARELVEEVLDDVLDDENDDVLDDDENEERSAHERALDNDERSNGPLSSEQKASSPQPSDNTTARSPGQDTPTEDDIEAEPVEIYGDAAYGEATFVEHCKNAGAEPYLKVQPPSARPGQFSKDSFDVDIERNTVTCPNGQTVPIRRSKDGAGRARFGEACRKCPLRENCTSSKRGRLIQIHPNERTLQEERQKQKNQPEWRKKYRRTRPKVERKLGHAKRRHHGGRRARMRGRERIAHDFALLAAGLNLQRLANLGIRPVTAAARRNYAASLG